MEAGFCYRVKKAIVNLSLYLTILRKKSEYWDIVSPVSMCPVLFLSHVSSCPYLVIFLFLLSSFDYSLITPHLFRFSLITSCVYKSWVPPESLSVLLSFKLCDLCFIIKTIISLPPVSCNLTTHDRDRYKLKLIVNWCKLAVFLLLIFFSQFQIYISQF